MNENMAFISLVCTCSISSFMILFRLLIIEMYEKQIQTLFIFIINQSMAIFSIFFFLACLSAISLSQDPPYTENLTEFKGKGFNTRKEKLIGCWLFVSQELKLFQSSNVSMQLTDIPEDKNLFSTKHLAVVKECIKHIPRKQAILKISSLVEEQNETLSRLDEIVKDWRNLIGLTQIPENSLSQFDEFLYKVIKKYEHQLNKANREGSIKDHIEKKLNKKNEQLQILNYIPTSGIAKTVFLASCGVMIFILCTCCRYKRMKDKTIEQRKKRKAQKRGQMEKSREKRRNALK